MSKKRKATQSGVSFRVSEVSPLFRDITSSRLSAGFHTGYCANIKGTPHPTLICPDAISDHPGLLVNQVHRHGFLSSILYAFNKHLPLSMRPEHIWTLILQAVSKHVHVNEEKLGPRLLKNEWKGELKLVRSGFIRGQPGHDWTGVLKDFNKQISDAVVQGTNELVGTDFSTSTLVEVIAGQIAMVDILPNQFAFQCKTDCGFPLITLEGTLSDWRSLREKAANLVLQKCLPNFASRWLPSLIPVLDKFVEQFENPSNVNVSFWQSFCKIGKTRILSGEYNWLNGWINVFFPSLRDDRPNEFCVPFHLAQENSGQCFQGPNVEKIPSGIAVAPVSWNYYGQKFSLEIRAGFVGAVQRRNGTITPEIGWYICERDVQQRPVTETNMPYLTPSSAYMNQFAIFRQQLAQNSASDADGCAACEHLTRKTGNRKRRKCSSCIRFKDLKQSKKTEEPRK